MNARRGFGGRLLATAAVAVAALALTACDGTSTSSITTARVAVSYPFGSLNSATAAGRSPGSTLVRGLTHVGFTRLDASGEVVPDPSFGTVEKVSDAPLTVRYTIKSGATWSDGVPVTGADLLLEWAARSGQFDEVVPKLGPDGSIADAAALNGVVAFAATSPALVHAPATPTFDDRSLTLVYDSPVADWQVALDVNLPAHVIGRIALHAMPTPTATATTKGATASPTPRASGSASARPGASSTDWAGRVADAIVHADRAELVPISAAWRTAGDVAALAADPSTAVTDGPYALTALKVGKQVVLEPNPVYDGPKTARFSTLVVRSDLDPLAQVQALDSNDVDVIAPVDTPDVRKVLAAARGAVVVEGGDRVLQLALSERSGGPFDPTAHPGSAAAARAGFLGSLDPAALAKAAGAPLSAQVLPQLGVPSAADRTSTSSPSATTSATATPTATPTATATPSPSASPTGGTARTTVHLLVDTGDPVRAALAAAITAEAAKAGYAVETVSTSDQPTALVSAPKTWDAAILPVGQGELPVAWVVDRWRTGGSTNVTGHADPALDAELDAAARQVDPAAARRTLSQVETALTASHVVLPLVRQPVLVATDPSGSSPAIDVIAPITWGSADLSGWWGWALH